MKITINNTEFETPFSVSGENIDILWFAKYLARATSQEFTSGAWSWLYIEDEGDYERDRLRREKEHEDRVLAQADEIRAKREAAGFGSSGEPPEGC